MPHPSFDRRCQKQQLLMMFSSYHFCKLCLETLDPIYALSPSLSFSLSSQSVTKLSSFFAAGMTERLLMWIIVASAATAGLESDEGLRLRKSEKERKRETQIRVHFCQTLFWIVTKIYSETQDFFFSILSLFPPAFLPLVFQPLISAQTGFTIGARQPSGLDYWSLI